MLFFRAEGAKFFLGSFFAPKARKNFETIFEAGTHGSDPGFLGNHGTRGPMVDLGTECNPGNVSGLSEWRA